MEEVYKIISGFNNLYSVSNYGNVINNKTGRPLTNSIGSHGYKQVNLSNNGICKTHTVHRLVANSFIDNPENKPIVDHKDNDKHNNHFSNLRFCTNQENLQNRKISKNSTTGIKGVSFN